jgi:S1-C subfamily serine protease
MEVVQMLFRRQASSGSPEVRGRAWTFVKVLLAVALVIGAVSGLTACTFETEPGAPTTASPETTEPVEGSATTETTEADGTSTEPPTTTTEGSSSGSQDQLASPAIAVAEKLGPSVVNIAISGVAQGPFGEQQQYSGEGSGVIYSSDGMIITNNHVVSDELGAPVGSLQVTLTTGEILPATIVGRDPLTDLAVIKVEADMDLPAAEFQVEDLTVGQFAIAIGSPLGFDNSVTMGIVSGIARSIEGIPGAEGVALTNLIQTDAPISPGNSGGALANAAGEVIGINVAYLPPAETGAVSLGFAIPAVVATEVADEIIDTGKATHAYMGVGTQMVTSQLQQQFGLSRSSGILIAEVTAGGPAAQAGIQQGDIIYAVDGEEMVESSDLLVAIRDMEPGDEVEVDLDRNGQEMTITVTLEERPANL